MLGEVFILTCFWKGRVRYYCGNVILKYHILANCGVACHFYGCVIWCLLVSAPTITCLSQRIVNLSLRVYCFVTVLFSVSVHLLTHLIWLNDFEVIFVIIIIKSKINVLIRQLITPFCYMVTLC